MLKIIAGLGDRVVGVEAHGEVTGEDYETLLIPAVERAIAAHGKIRFLYHIGPDVGGFTGAAIWDDARVGLRHMNAWEKVAVVTDVHWIVDAMKMFRVFMPGRVKVFTNAELQAAKTWVQSEGQ